MAEPLVGDLLDRRAVQLTAKAADRVEAILLCGLALLEVGAVAPSYVDSMLERERSVSTYVGEQVAIPHGTLAGKDAVYRDALCFLRFPDGVDWGDGAAVSVCIGIAAAGGGHVGILAQLAQILLDSDRAEALRTASDVDTVLALLQPSTEEATT
jgi:PTS system mannitol-specific IIA component